MWLPHPNINDSNDDPLLPTATSALSVDEKEKGNDGGGDSREEPGRGKTGRSCGKGRTEEVGEEKVPWA